MNRLVLAVVLAFAAAAPAAAQMDALMAQARERFNANDAHGAISPLAQGLSIAESQGQQQAIGDFAQNLGMAYDYDNQPAPARRYYEQAIRVYRNIGDQADLAVTISWLGVLVKNEGDNAKGLELMNEALAMARAQRNENLEGQILGNIGNAYSNWSKHKQALDFHTQALTLQTRLGDKSGVANDLQNIAADHQAMGDYPKAIDYSNRALTAAREAADKYSEAGIYTNFGTIYLETGDYPKAIASYERGNSMFRELNDKRNLALGLTNLSLVYEAQSDLPKALELFNQSLALSREVGDKLQEGATLNNAGIVYLDMGDLPRALDYFNQSYRIAENAGRKAGVGSALNNTALAYGRIGDLDKALTTAQNSLKYSEEGFDRTGLANTYNQIGGLYQEKGEYAKAVEQHLRSIALSKEIGVPTEQAEIDLASAYLATGNLAGAAELAAKAGNEVLSGRVAYAKGQYPAAKALFAKAAAEGKGKRTADAAVAASAGLCLTLEKLKDLAGARAACEDAIATIERQRDLLPQSARGRFLSVSVTGFPRLEIYKARARVADAAADGLYWAENAKARVFVEEVAARLGSSKAALPAADAAKENELAARVAGVYKQLDAAFEKKNTTRVAELEKELAAALAARDAFVADLRKTAPAYAAIQYPQPLKAAALSLKADELLVEYAVTESKTMIYAVGADKKAAVFTAAITRADLNKLVAAFRKPFENPLDAQGKFAGAFDAASGAKLYSLLLGPVTAAAKGKKLVIVPDEILGLLPFEALVASAAKPKTAQAPASPMRYAADAYDIAYAQSATALTQARATAGEQAPGGLLVVADPVFDKSDERLKGSGLEAFVSRDFVTMGVAATRRGAGFTRLEETGALAETLKASFGDGAVAFTGKDATKSKLLGEDLGRYRHLVFATHGILDGDVPYVGEPALVLTQVGTPDGDDGYLKMSEIMGLKLHSDVVALTACKTGLGREVRGEGVMGLGRAFQYAGAKNALVSLWSVSEKSTTEMTAAFFAALKAGKTPREALKTARAQLRKGAYGNPFFWAPFVLIGA